MSHLCDAVTVTISVLVTHACLRYSNTSLMAVCPLLSLVASLINSCTHSSQDLAILEVRCVARNVGLGLNTRTGRSRCFSYWQEFSKVHPALDVVLNPFSDEYTV